MSSHLFGLARLFFIFWIVAAAIAGVLFAIDAPTPMAVIAAIAGSVMLLLMIGYALAGFEALAKSVEATRARVAPDDEQISGGVFTGDQ